MALFGRKTSDDWLTPDDVWRDVKIVLKVNDVIWEPFVSHTHHVSKDTWQDCGIQCIETTTDFFNEKMPEEATVLVSNPPFSRKFDVLRSCLERSNLRFALLLPSWVFASATVRKIIKEFGAENNLSLIVPTKRVHYLHPETLKQM